MKPQIHDANSKTVNASYEQFKDLAGFHTFYSSQSVPLTACENSWIMSSVALEEFPKFKRMTLMIMNAPWFL